jgi:hypothetical protein
LAGVTIQAAWAIHGQYVDSTLGNGVNEWNQPSADRTRKSNPEEGIHPKRGSRWREWCGFLLLDIEGTTESSIDTELLVQEGSGGGRATRKVHEGFEMRMTKQLAGGGNPISTIVSWAAKEMHL